MNQFCLGITLFIHPTEKQYEQILGNSFNVQNKPFNLSFQKVLKTKRDFSVSINRASIQKLGD